jgi:micrococcal nuclease
MKNKLFSVVVALSFLLVGCKTVTYTCPTVTDLDELYETPVTDNYDFVQKDSYVGKSFVNDGIGVATLKSCTDGDTANFNVAGYSETVKLRFLAINTPESTAKVEPWGKKASIFTKHILENAAANGTIVLINDIDEFGQFDNSGGRFLGFIWYKIGDGSWRLLNLEIVEQGYSKSTLFSKSKICDYEKVFQDLDKKNEFCKKRVYGEVDPGFDYSKEVITTTIKGIREHYEEYGISETSGSSGLRLRVTALVTGLAGDNLIIRDITEPYEEGPLKDLYAGIYVYAGFTSGLASITRVGDVVDFYCRATTFNGNIQLSDINSKTLGPQNFTVLAREIKNNDVTPEYLEIFPDYSSENPPYLPYDLATSTFNDISEFAPYTGATIQTDIEIRYIQPGETDEDGNIIQNGEEIYYREDASHNVTIYARAKKANGEYFNLNLRVDGSSYPRLRGTDIDPTHTYRVTGLLNPYFESYQIQFFNYASKYLVDLGEL